MRPVKIYFITAVIFLIFDSLWLGVLSKSLYENHLYPVINFGFDLPAAIAFYLIYIAGIVHFVVGPALQTKNSSQALKQGALLGGLCYATYDLTNMATIQDWPLLVVVVDILWGMIITGGSAWLSYAVCQRMN